MFPNREDAEAQARLDQDELVDPNEVLEELIDEMGPITAFKSLYATFYPTDTVAEIQDSVSRIVAPMLAELDKAGVKFQVVENDPTFLAVFIGCAWAFLAGAGSMADHTGNGFKLGRKLKVRSGNVPPTKP